MKKLFTSLLLGFLFASAVPFIPSGSQIAYAATEEVYQCRRCGRKATPAPFVGLPQAGCGGNMRTPHYWTKLEQ